MTENGQCRTCTCALSAQDLLNGCIKESPLSSQLMWYTFRSADSADIVSWALLNFCGLPKLTQMLNLWFIGLKLFQYIYKINVLQIYLFHLYKGSMNVKQGAIEKLWVRVAKDSRCWRHLIDCDGPDKETLIDERPSFFVCVLWESGVLDKNNERER